MINSVNLVGRLTKQPELTKTTNDVAKVQFTLAVNRSFANQNGEKEADFVLCVAWRKTAENMAKFLQKGSLIGVEGAIRTRNFEGKDGNRVFMTEVNADNVHFLETNNNQQSRNTQSNSQQQNYSQQPQQQTQQQQGYQQPQNNQQQSYQEQQQQQNYQQNQQFAGSTAGYGGQGQGNYEVHDDDLPF